MQDPKLFTLVIYVFLGVLLAVLSIPMITRKLKPNPWYGFRVPKTLKNPDIWYDVNAYSGKLLFIAGVLTALTAIIAYFIPNLSIDAFVWITLGVSTAAIMVAVMMGFVYLSKR